MKTLIQKSASHQKEVGRILGQEEDAVTNDTDFNCYNDHDFYKTLLTDFLNSANEKDVDIEHN